MATTNATLVSSIVAPVEIVNPVTKAAKAITVSGKVAVARPVQAFCIRAQKEEKAPSASRRSLLNLLAASVAAGALSTSPAYAEPVKIGGPPPPSGGLPGTLNADIPRDLDLPLKDRFFIQKVSSKDTAARLKVALNEITSVKPFLDKKAWTSAREGLRSSAYYLRSDIDSLISEKPKTAQKALKAEAKAALEKLEALDGAARAKSPEKVEASYSAAVAALTGIVSKLA